MLPSPPPNPRRIVYFGSPRLAVGPLEALVNAGFDVVLVVSRADRRRSRNQPPEPSPVKAAAQRLGLAVTDDVNETLRVEADLGVVVAYGRLIKRNLLERLPFVNLHVSLLPRWRGAAPVERAILAGDETTGVCVMALEEALDTGGVYRRAETKIDPDETLDELRTRLVAVGTDLLLDALRTGFGPAQPQSGEPTYAGKIDPSELELDWARPAVELHRTIRLGRAWTTFRAKRLLIWRSEVRGDSVPRSSPYESAGTPERAGTMVDDCVVTGDGLLALIDVQPEGKRRQHGTAWRNGVRPAPGERLGE